MITEVEVKIGFGALSGTIASQLKKQKIVFDVAKIKHCEKLKECILHLSFSSIISDKEKEKAFDKLFKRIIKICSK